MKIYSIFAPPKWAYRMRMSSKIGYYFLFLLCVAAGFKSIGVGKLHKPFVEQVAVTQKAIQSSLASNNAEETHMVIRNRHATENEVVSVSNPNTTSYIVATRSQFEGSYYSKWYSYFAVAETLPKQRVSPPIFGLRAPPYLV